MKLRKIIDVRYKSDDGEEFDSPEQAVRRKLYGVLVENLRENLDVSGAGFGIRAIEEYANFLASRLASNKITPEVVKSVFDCVNFDEIMTVKIDEISETV